MNNFSYLIKLIFVVVKYVINWEKQFFFQFISQNGPVATAIYASKYLQSYKSGVLRDPLCKSNSQVNHAVAIIGYGTQNSKDHWLFRNSWGTGWGMNGYFMLTRGINHCNLMSLPFYFEMWKQTIQIINYYVIYIFFLLDFF